MDASGIDEAPATSGEAATGGDCPAPADKPAGASPDAAGTAGDPAAPPGPGGENVKSSLAIRASSAATSGEPQSGSVGPPGNRAPAREAPGEWPPGVAGVSEGFGSCPAASVLSSGGAPGGSDMVMVR